MQSKLTEIHFGRQNDRGGMSRLRGGLDDDFQALKDLYSVNSKCAWSAHAELKDEGEKWLSYNFPREFYVSSE